MYEDMTFELLINRMLDNVPNDMDKREGSIIYDALAPAALELATMYIELDVILTETYAISSSRNFLILRAIERGLSPYPPSQAVLKGIFNMPIDENSRFYCGELVYYSSDHLSVEVIDNLTYYSHKMICESTGSIGNKNFGDLIPINYIQGLTYAKQTELLIPGDDDEDTETFRERYLASFDPRAYGGNKADYKEKTNAIAGVGATKVTPVWNGGGTVLLTILDSEYNPATDVLIDTVQELIDPTKDHTGVGIAPIGHVVTVRTADIIDIDITLNIIFEINYTFENQQYYINNIINEYIAELRKDWVNNDNITVRTVHIEARLLDIAGIIDIHDTLINGKSENLVLTKYQIPVFNSSINGGEIYD